MLAYAPQEKEEKVCTDGDDSDFGEFGIIERTDESHGCSRAEIICKLRLFAEELDKTTSESPCRNAVVNSLIRTEGPDYIGAEEACVNYFSIWHFKYSKKN